jgi:hypothetical protein
MVNNRNTYTLNDCVEFAINKNGVCLSIAYINSRSKLHWECKFGHTWDATFKAIKRGHWCPHCAILKRSLSIDDCNAMAKENNGKCLSKEYINNGTKLLWQCELGHQWHSTFTLIKNQKTWCPICSGNVKLTLDDCINAALINGGRCLSQEYNNIMEYMLWECSIGHRWQTSFNRIRNSNSWCPICATTQLFECQKYAIKNNGLCLSVEYNCKTKIKWRCEFGHMWESFFSCIKGKNSWCPECAGNIKYTLDDCVAVALLNGGKCLSSIYNNVKENMIWQCKNNHIWEAAFTNIKKRTWCPYCAHQISKAQQELYEILIALFPLLDIVLNDTHTIKPLHLDIYMPELKLAIEYDGEYWHYSDWAIKNGSLEKMEHKNNICQEKGISLLRIRESEWMQNKELAFQTIIDFIDSV